MFASTRFLLANGVGSLGTLSTNETTGQATDSASYWVRGFVAAASNEFAESGAVGSLVSNVLGPATVVGVYWRSFLGAAFSGQIYVEVTGNRAAGSVSSFTLGGTSQGAFGAPTYNAGKNTTTFPVGGSVTNVFAGTQAIVIS